MKSRLLTLFVLVGLITTGNMFAQVQSWTVYIDWAATNRDAGRAVGCPNEYMGWNVKYAIVSGGRSAVINEALLSAYRGDVDRAYQLVLLTQCNNSEGQSELMQAGQNAVVSYLVLYWIPSGVDPQTAAQGAQYAISILIGN